MPILPPIGRHELTANDKDRLAALDTYVNTWRSLETQTLAGSFFRGGVFDFDAESPVCYLAMDDAASVLAWLFPPADDRLVACCDAGGLWGVGDDEYYPSIAPTHPPPVEPDRVSVLFMLPLQRRAGGPCGITTRRRCLWFGLVSTHAVRLRDDQQRPFQRR